MTQWVYNKYKWNILFHWLLSPLLGPAARAGLVPIKYCVSCSLTIAFNWIVRSSCILFPVPFFGLIIKDEYV